MTLPDFLTRLNYATTSEEIECLHAYAKEQERAWAEAVDIAAKRTDVVDCLAGRIPTWKALEELIAMDDWANPKRRATVRVVVRL